MQQRGAWGRRGIVAATITLSFALIAPGLAAPAGAAVGPGLRHPARTEAQRKARVIAAMRAHGYTKAAKLAKLRALATKTRPTLKKGAKKPRATAPRTAAQRRRALRLRRQAAARRATARRRAATKRRTARALAARRAAKNSAPLSLPLLAFLAILPFVLIGLYLLGADYWRQRGHREPRGPRKRGGASLVITRVGDR